MDNKKYSEVFSIEEARELVAYIKEALGENMIKDITIEEDEYSFYDPDDEMIGYSTDYEDEDQEHFMIEYVNSEFGTNMPDDVRFWGMFSILHELGHHVDLSGRDKENLEEYHKQNIKKYDIMHDKSEEHAKEFYATVLEMELLINLFDVGEATEEDLENILARHDRLIAEKKVLDYEYRQLESEKVADAWAAFFLKTFIENKETKFSY
jgi:hypothetical protein